ncbi:MAG: Hsp70 family protein, partial [Archangiaceae bacterium]|nr:Hsp70 family protein [Archangiaceae bacterium]
VEQMLLDSIENGEADIQRRLLVEQQVEATRVLVDARKQLVQNGDLLSADERKRFELGVEALEALMKSTTDHATLKNAIHELDEQAKPFVERIMNRAIAKAAVGHSIQSF